MARKTYRQKRAEFEEMDAKVWELFLPKLQSVTTFVGALQLLDSAPGSDRPGRKYYSNLGFFLQTFAAPLGASSTELREYLRMIGCFDEEGALTPGVRSGLEKVLEAAIQTKSPFGF